MSKTIRIKKGLDIRLQGEAEKVLAQADPAKVIAIKPTDFHGLTPKLLVAQGDQVKAGTPLFRDKYNERVVFTSPVSGEVAEVVRGEKRRILEVRVLADAEPIFEEHGGGDPATMDRDAILEQLLKTGCWPFIRQRPFDVIADPKGLPKAILVPAFNTAPLAADLDFVMRNQGADFQDGLNALAKLTSGRVHLNVSAQTTGREFLDAKQVQVNTFEGPHPAGNIGVQLHHLDPLNKGEVVWFCYPQDVAMIGRTLRSGHFDGIRTVAITGSEAKVRRYVRTRIGTPVAHLVGEVGPDVRVISGDPLSGDNVGKDGYLGAYHSQITILPEGDAPKFFLTDGWLSPGFDKFSASRSFPSWIMSGKRYAPDTNQNGEERAFVVTGQYEKVFPFDIYPVHLIKAVLVNDIELMENLGILEVAPEDFALCEYVCTSKIASQRIIREGLDTYKKETT
ncbi:MAG: Na(+)-translocating NADH-quinone reductase subunit A [Flavobacteriales bacterium]|nr:Na(+)-translocating NADH-quinone reductase subunit A [Flavobacteriales bacterium]